MLIEKIEFATPKTKEMQNLLNTLNLADKKVLVMVNELSENVILASRNLGNVLLIEASEVNVFDLVNADVVLMEEAAKEYLEEVLI